MKIEKIDDKLDFDIEAQWNCNSSTHCKVKNYTNKNTAPPVVGGGAISVSCTNPKWDGTYRYSTSGWSVF